MNDADIVKRISADLEKHYRYTREYYTNNPSLGNERLYNFLKECFRIIESYNCKDVRVRAENKNLIFEFMLPDDCFTNCRITIHYKPIVIDLD